MLTENNSQNFLLKKKKKNSPLFLLFDLINISHTLLSCSLCLPLFVHSISLISHTKIQTGSSMVLTMEEHEVVVWVWVLICREAQLLLV